MVNEDILELAVSGLSANCWSARRASRTFTAQDLAAPDGANLVVCRELRLSRLRPAKRRTLRLSRISLARLRPAKRLIRGFLRRELIGWLIDACELQENPREIVLRLVGQGGHGFDSLFKQAGHAANIVLSASLRKPRGWSRPPYGFPIAIAIAAARNGNGSETAARNQTNLAGMNGISQRIMRWNPNSAQATT